MENCEACGAALAESETQCSSCGLVFDAGEPTPAIARTNPIDGSPIYPSSGPPIETELDPQPTLGDDEVQQLVAPSVARKQWTSLLVPALVLVLTLVGTVYWIVSSPADEMEEIAADLAAYSSRTPAQETTRELTPREALEQFRVATPLAYERALAKHRALDPETSGDPHTLTATLLECAVGFDPDFAAGLGSHPHPSDVTVFDDEYSCRWLFLAADLLDALQAWRQSRNLTPHERTDAELLRTQLLMSRAMEPEQGNAWLLDRIEASFDPLPLLTIFMCCPEEERVAAALNRLRAIEARLAEAPALLMNLPQAVVLSAVRRVRAIRTYVGEYPAKWVHKYQVLDEQCDATIRALEVYERALGTEVYLRAKGNLGVGSSAYAATLAQQGLPPELTQTLAQDAAGEYAVLQKQFAQFMRGLKGVSRPARLNTRSATDEDSSDAIQFYKSNLDEWIVVSPKNDSGVRIEPAPSLWTHAGGGLYLAPGLLAPRSKAMIPRFLTVTSTNHQDGSHMLTAEHVAAHEVYPGHHLHFLLARESSCDVRLLFEAGVSVEGWAVYATELAHEVQPHAETGAFDTYIRAFESMSLAFDASFEALLHTRTASAEELLELLKLHYRDDKLTLADVGDRARHPGAFSKYFAGERAIRRLRDRIIEQQGAEFDSRVFHERLLRAGFVPPALLEVEFLSEP